MMQTEYMMEAKMLLPMATLIYLKTLIPQRSGQIIKTGTSCCNFMVLTMSPEIHRDLILTTVLIIAYAHALDYWSVDNPSGESFLPRWAAPGQMNANYYLVDGSYCRLKNAEIAYNFSGGILKKLTVSSLRIYLNGNNLLFWSKELPDDREYGYGNSYPSVKRFNLGVDIKF